VQHIAAPITAVLAAALAVSLRQRRNDLRLIAPPLRSPVH
jgi:hypothetical protein